jgi:hypothetical protein
MGADEAAAEAALPEARPGLDAARWGVRDVRRVHGSSPSSPARLHGLDGAEYVLLQRPEEAAAPVLRVGVRKGEEKRVLEVFANTAGADAPCSLSIPARCPSACWPALEARGRPGWPPGAAPTACPPRV